MSENFLYSEAIATADADGTITDSYTNMVSAEDLNNIAVDLGCAEFANSENAFADGQEYTVDALNRITSSLVTAGVLLTGSRCKPTISDGTISIADGICVFANGAKKRLTSPETVSFIEGGINYVYFLNNTSNGNKISLVNSLAEPKEGDAMMLAEVSEDGILTDRRKFSKANCAIPGTKNAMYTYSTILQTTNAVRTLVIELDGSEFNFISVLNPNNNCLRCFRLTDENGADLEGGIEVTWADMWGSDVGSYYSHTILNITKTCSTITIKHWRTTNKALNISSQFYFV